MGSGGSGILPEGTPCGRMYNAKREVHFIYTAKREVNLRVTWGYWNLAGRYPLWEDT